LTISRGARVTILPIIPVDIAELQLDSVINTLIANIYMPIEDKGRFGVLLYFSQGE